MVHKLLTFCIAVAIPWIEIYTLQVCPSQCICLLSGNNEYTVNCDGYNQSISANQTTSFASPSCFELLHLDVLPSTLSVLFIQCFNASLISGINFSNFNKLSRVSIVEASLETAPLTALANSENLKFLNISNNNIKQIHVPQYSQFAHLEVLDLSRNQITEVYFETDSAPKIKHLHIQDNQLTVWDDVENINSLELLDISRNPIDLKKSSFHVLTNLNTIIVQGVPFIAEFRSNTCNSVTMCKILPESLGVLDLSSNSLLNVPSCDGLLTGLLNLRELYLENNRISVITDDTFRSYCFANLSTISLDNNRIIQISPYSLVNLHQLRTLALNNNYLQHMPLTIMQKFSSIRQRADGRNSIGILLDNNAWSCDCFQLDLHNWLSRENSSLSIQCELPEQFRGRQLRNISLDELACTNTSISRPINVTVAEYEDGKLGCEAHGVPKPTVVWFTPKGKKISIESLASSYEQQNLYDLSVYGEVLTVRDVELSKTGIYRCMAVNPISTSNETVALSVVLSNTTTIIYIILACGAFMVAIILNSVNMCMYIYEHLKAKRLYKKALQKQDEEEKENPPIRARSRTLDESIASLNANRHYGRYDFTCQQLFLDTVIKGAHTVKKTLYDARHSEFSANMWEYAANLRDRLHIELPSYHVQLPTISMPSISMPSMPNISMPTISMPSIPTMQDINTNIEKLGSSMVTRSHNLATSVGSVFTLKRWMWQQQNSSDNESRDSDELLQNSGITSVKVDVHKPSHQTEVDGCSSKLLSRYARATSRSDYGVIQEGRSTNSLPDYRRRTSDIADLAASSGKVVLQKKKTETCQAKVVRFDSTEDLEPVAKLPVHHSAVIEYPALETISAAVDRQCHSYETSL